MSSLLRCWSILGSITLTARETMKMAEEEYEKYKLSGLSDSTFNKTMTKYMRPGTEEKTLHCCNYSSLKRRRICVLERTLPHLPEERRKQLFLELRGSQIKQEEDDGLRPKMEQFWPRGIDTSYAE